MYLISDARNNYFGLLTATVICTTGFAFLSWHLVEKRFLRLRKYFSAKSAKIFEELHPDGVATDDPAESRHDRLVEQASLGLPVYYHSMPDRDHASKGIEAVAVPPDT